MAKDIYVGLLGFGTVGTGVVRVLQENAEDIAQKAGARIHIKKVLVRDITKKREYLEKVELTNRPEDIMDDPTYGNRLGQWFWNMIVNLGLGSMDDDKFDPGYVEYVIYRFLNREYEKNGKGGLFTIRDTRVDMRKAEIWYQAMWYLNEFLEEQEEKCA